MRRERFRGITGGEQIGNRNLVGGGRGQERSRTIKRTNANMMREESLTAHLNTTWGSSKGTEEKRRATRKTD